MIKTIIFALALGASPAAALAAGDHAGDHDPAHRHTPGGSMSTTSFSTGQAGDPAKISRTIEVGMDDTMRFNPATIQVAAGQTVRFVVKNFGMIPHEMVIGSLPELLKHAAQMRSSPDMSHAEPNAVVVQQGQQGELVWQFDKAGRIDFACLIPGHMEAGMVGKVKVI